VGSERWAVGSELIRGFQGDTPWKGVASLLGALPSSVATTPFQGVPPL
jgi:hypothetical protein